MGRSTVAYAHPGTDGDIAETAGFSPRIGEGTVVFRAWEETSDARPFRAVITFLEPSGVGREELFTARSLDELCELLQDRFGHGGWALRPSGAG